MEGEELLSRALQHEIDHLDGMLFIDRLSRLKRDLVREGSRSAEERRVVALKLVFCGTPEFAVPTLRAVLEAGHEVALVLTQPDRPAGRGMEMQVPAVKLLAVERGLAVMQPERIKKNEEFRARLEGIQPDAILVVAYGRIIPQWMLSSRGSETSICMEVCCRSTGGRRRSSGRWRMVSGDGCDDDAAGRRAGYGGYVAGAGGADRGGCYGGGGVCRAGGDRVGVDGGDVGRSGGGELCR